MIITMIRAIVIDPNTKTVSELYIDPGLEGLKYALGTDPRFSGYVERVGLSDTEDLWLDEERCLSAHRPVFELGSGSFAGTCLILAHDDEGESVSSKLSRLLIENNIRWTNLETTGDFGPSKKYETDHPVLGRVPVYEGGKPIYQERLP